jgi:hypothetical protein
MIRRVMRVWARTPQIRINFVAKMGAFSTWAPSTVVKSPAWVSYPHGEYLPKSIWNNNRNDARTDFETYWGLHLSIRTMSMGKPYIIDFAADDRALDLKTRNLKTLVKWLKGLTPEEREWFKRLVLDVSHFLS